MSKTKLPVRVVDDVREKFAQVDTRSSDLAEIIKRSGEYSEHYGKLWGGLIQLSLANAATGRRPFLWGGLVSLFTVAGGFILKYTLTRLLG